MWSIHPSKRSFWNKRVLGKWYSGRLGGGGIIHHIDVIKLEF